MDLKPSSNKLSSVPSTTLAAVAYQDHLIRDLSLGDLSLAKCSLKKPTVRDAIRRQEKKRKDSIKKVASVVDTGIKKKSHCINKQDPVVDKEYVLDPKPRPLTLAQKFGLYPCSEDQRRLLTEEEWKALKAASTNRDDFLNPCVICKEQFELEDQVLLSCSHVFHRACLQAFERFTGKKSCPMCRRTGYQTRVVHDGSKAFRQKCATKIQSQWRGYIVRKWYLNLRRTVPPKDAKLRKKFYENKLSEITDRLVSSVATERVDRFLHDIDESIQSSRDIFQHWENARLTQLTEADWVAIEARASERAATDCPICLRRLNGDLSKVEKSNTALQDAPPNSIALLSCSHVFHATCLQALEYFAMTDADCSHDHVTHQPMASVHLTTSSPTSFKCPVCRSLYIKRLLVAC